MALYDLHDQPTLDHPVLVMALEGWIDAGFAAGSAAQTLLEGLDTFPVATCDADQLLDHRAQSGHFPSLRQACGHQCCLAAALPGA